MSDADSIGDAEEVDLATARQRRGLRGSVFPSAWRFTGWALGAKERGRLALLVPVGLALAASETVFLLATIRLLLALVDDADVVEVTLVGVELRIAFERLALIAVACSALNITLRFVLSRIVGGATAAVVAAIRGRILRTWFGMSWQHSSKRRLGELQSLLGQYATAGGVAVGVLVSGGVALLSLAAYVSVVVVTAPIVAAAFLGIGVLVYLVLVPLRTKAKAAARTNRRANRELLLTATSYAQLNRELHVFGATGAAVDELTGLSGASSTSLRRLRQLSSLLPNLYQQLVLLGVVVVVVLARRVEVDAAAFGTAAVLAVRSVSYVQQLNSLTQSYLESEPMLEEVVAVVKEQRSLAGPAGKVPLERIERLRLEDVSFSYDGQHLALDGIDLDIRAGDWVGIIGPSGGGKTTLASIIAGLAQPTSGRYTVNDRVATEHRRDDWARQFGLLSQEPTVLRATAMENVRFHRPQVSDEDILAAASDAAVRDEVEALPGGWTTPMGDGRTTMSGGQRQRLALARALAGHPSVLILDEPTSALDAANERLIELSLGALDPSAIVIVVAHRPSLLERCGVVYRIEGGRIVDRRDDGEPAAIDDAGKG